MAGRSMLLRTIDELRAADVACIVVVTSPSKPAMANHLEMFGDLERGDVEIAVQEVPNGLVDAVAIACNGRQYDATLVALPDVLFVGHPNPSAALLEETRTEADGVVVVRPESPWGDLLSDVGRVDSESIKEIDGGLRIKGISNKRKGEPFPLGVGAWRICGRSLWTNSFWTAREKVERDGGWDEGERSDAAVLRRLVDSGDLVAVPIDASYIDVGIPSGLAHARDKLHDMTTMHD